MTKIEWTNEDSAQAVAEGWAISQVDDGDHPPFELQAWYDSGIFVDGNSADDKAAVSYVIEQAANGNPFHLRALLYIEQNSPQEAKHWEEQGLWPLWLKPMLVMLESMTAEVESALEDSIGYVIGSIGSSYCDTDQSDWEFLHRLEDTLGVPRTSKDSFY